MNKDALFEMIWNGDDSLVKDTIQSLDNSEIISLIETISQKKDEGVKFDLLLNLKKLVLDNIIVYWNNWPLLYSKLHPMEILYVLLNLNIDPCEFFSSPLDCSNVFSYIINWINRQIKNDDLDIGLYQVYFYDYSKLERIRVFNILGLDLLKYISSQGATKDVLELVPLLKKEYLDILGVSCVAYLTSSQKRLAVLETAPWYLAYIGDLYATDLAAADLYFEHGDLFASLPIVALLCQYSKNPQLTFKNLLNSSYLKSNESRLKQLEKSIEYWKEYPSIGSTILKQNNDLKDVPCVQRFIGDY